MNDMLSFYDEIITNAKGPRDVFFAGVAYGALCARMTQEEILKLIVEATEKKNET